MATTLFSLIMVILYRVNLTKKKGHKVNILRMANGSPFELDKDFRYYLIRKLETHDALSPKALNHWKFIPEEWVEQAAKADAKVLFNH